MKESNELNDVQKSIDEQIVNINNARNRKFVLITFLIILVGLFIASLEGPANVFKVYYLIIQSLIIGRLGYDIKRATVHLAMERRILVFVQDLKRHLYNSTFVPGYWLKK